ncbi:hypothetical protein AMTR_s00169p00047080 [Amborella trichopoda]|uniref:Uncharacterized protein n=1 Tax=Amborella trichopoda TaxID=13333 RepID=W1PQQ9_AMBTC|nr:hypothetical protein AMTR_s00169p00047080 [Amborella trichopoda]
MHCWSACVSSAGELCLKCRSALCNHRSVVAAEHVSPERPLRLPGRSVFSIGVPCATAGALCLQRGSALCNCRSAVAPEHVLPERHLRLPERIVSRTACIAGVPFGTAGAHCTFTAGEREACAKATG